MPNKKPYQYPKIDDVMSECEEVFEAEAVIELAIENNQRYDRMVADENKHQTVFPVNRIGFM